MSFFPLSLSLLFFFFFFYYEDANRLRVIGYLQQNGFYKEGEVTFPHKQSAVMKIKRDSWECPAI